MRHLPNATLRTYLEVFKDTYLTAAERYIEERYRHELFRFPRLSGRTVGYIDSKAGAGYEYFPDEPEGIEVRRVGARVDVGFLGSNPVRMARLSPMTMVGVDSDLTIRNFSFKDLLPFVFERGASDAYVTLDNIDVTVGGLRRHIDYGLFHSGADEPTKFWSEANAVRRASDEILAGITDIRQLERDSISLEDFVANYKRKTVLVLGDYGAGQARLDTICQSLSRLGYRPLLVKDIPDFPGYDVPGKFRAIAAVSRFLIFEDSSASGHLDEFEIARVNDWIVVTLRKHDERSTWMTAGASLTSRIIEEHTYAEGTLETAVATACQWAEEQISTLERERGRLYPWLEPNEKAAPTK